MTWWTRRVRRPGNQGALGGGRGRVALLVFALAATGCGAHLPAPGERVAFLERSSLSMSSDRSEAFEVDPALHLLLWNELDDQRIRAEGGVATVGTFSFLGSFRLLRGESTPMRVPTFEPRARVQVFRDVVLAREEGPPHRLLGGLEAFVGHRSNGQDGCALRNHTRFGSTDFACTPDTDPPDLSLDTRLGSFTTNYVGVGASGLWAAPHEGDRPPWAVVGASASTEWNVACGLGACMSAKLRQRYGAALFRWSTESEFPALWQVVHADRPTDVGLRVGASGVVHAFAAARKPFGEVSAEAAVVVRPRGALTLALFVRRHDGSDPLNIRFEERLDAWIFGLSVEGATFASAHR